MIVALLAFDSDAATFSGRVADTNGIPVAGATIEIAGHSTKTSHDGVFSLSATDSDAYALRVSAPGNYAFLHTYSRADEGLGPEGEGGIDVGTISLVPRDDNRTLLLFAGDAMMGRRFVDPRANEQALVRSGREEADMRAILEHVKPYVELADFASVNLETQLSPTPLSDALPKSVTFVTHPAFAAALRWTGFDYVALGNNHTYDYLDEGLDATLAAVQSAGLAYSGAGIDDAAARAPAEIDVDSQALRLLSYVGWRGRAEPSQVAETNKGGAALGTADNVTEDLAAAEPGTIDIIQYHSGLEYKSKPPLAEETLLKTAIDAGADLAIGHHAHVLQGFEIYRDRLIAYSLGNFAFDQYLPSTHSSMLVYAWYDGDTFVRAEIVPMHLNGYVPTPATGRLRYDIMQRIARLSAALGTCVGESGAHLVIEPCAEPNARQSLADDGQKTARHVAELGATPVPAIGTVNGSRPFRLGLDRLRRGDFEYVDLFDTDDRTWIAHPSVRITPPPRAMQIDVSPGEPVRTGMRVFTRTFTRSNPATVLADLASDGCATVTFFLQRRPDGMGFNDALDDGPIVALGSARVATGLTSVEIDFQLPRTFTRSIRLLLDAESCDADTGVLSLDNLALVEWQTPWLKPGALVPKADSTQVTHVQFRAH